ncbi:MAG: NAD-dependent epimerase/dehydratase family protein [Dehalococcoidia bacterium]|nr:NAD-dependent epimerase/dehydratase family protein [Dehalococcoidia bacterium]
MKVLVTGHNGYIGSVLVPLLQSAGHEVAGLDTYFYKGCSLHGMTRDVPSLQMDVRDVQEPDLVGFDAVIHLAALSNDPLGDLDAGLTYAINHRASVRLARLAKDAGVSRFLFSSSCSLYGASGDDYLTESASFNPVTPYGESKILTEQDVSQLADADFSPTYLRNATAYGVSDRLRADLVVNNLTGYALLTGEVLIKSDGTSWRPLVHIEDISRAFLAALEAPRDLVHNQAFNVGQTAENYRISDVAEIVRDVVPGSRITYAGGGSADARNYRVDCDKIALTLPGFRPQWTVRRGVEQLYEAFQLYGLEEDDFLGPRYQRLKRVRELMDGGELEKDLRWRVAALAV